MDKGEKLEHWSETFKQLYSSLIAEKFSGKEESDAINFDKDTSLEKATSMAPYDLVLGLDAWSCCDHKFILNFIRKYRIV